MRTEIGLHCQECVVEDPRVPMPLFAARQYGLGHTSAILDQAARGLHRTFLVWLTGSATGAAVARLTGRRVPLAWVVALAAGAQVTWVAGFATVSGTRTALRLTRLDEQELIPIRIRCPAGGPKVLACAHHSPLRDSHYVDGVFAWPRGGGGGSLILRRLLAMADQHHWALTLTALSPRTASAYRRVGFRRVVWIYWMRREAADSSGRLGSRRLLSDDGAVS